jgi:hypothetical protein
MVSLAAGVSGEENDPIVAEGSEAEQQELEPAAEETVDAADPEETEEPEEAEDVEEPEAGEDAQNPDEDEEPEKSEEPEAGEVAEEPEETDSEVIAGQQETANAEAELAAEDELTELNLDESMFFRKLDI